MSDLQCPATILLIASNSVGADSRWRALEGQRFFDFYVGIISARPPSHPDDTDGCEDRQLGMAGQRADCRTLI
jgi:hypothetical protein